MIHFFGDLKKTVFIVQTNNSLSNPDIKKLQWLFADQPKIEESVIADFFVGPRAAMITPWSTNAVEITQNMGIEGIIRIEEFKQVTENYSDFDPMLSQKYSSLSQSIQFLSPGLAFIYKRGSFSFEKFILELLKFICVFFISHKFVLLSVCILENDVKSL